MMYMILLIFALLDRPSTPVQFETQTICVDEVEVNQWTTCNSTQTQLIYRRWFAGRMTVVGWQLGDDSKIISDSSGYVVKHRQFLIRAKTVRHSSTVKDMEREEFRRWGYGERVQELCGGW